MFAARNMLFARSAMGAPPSMADSFLPTFASHGTAVNGEQGLTMDDAHFYWGENNGNGVPGTIFKTLKSDLSAVANFDGPRHCHALDIREDHDTLLVSGVDTETPYLHLWEISKTGTKIREWDFTDEFIENRGAAVYVRENTIYWIDQTGTEVLNIIEVTIHDDGTYTVGNTWTTDPGFNLGQHQGSDFANGFVYHLVDVDWHDTGSGGRNNKCLYEFKLEDDNSITITTVFNWWHTIEMEGLAFSPDKSELFFGDIQHNIFKLDSPPPAASAYETEVRADGPLATRNLSGAAEVFNGTSTQVAIGTEGDGLAIRAAHAMTLEAIVSVANLAADGAILGNWEVDNFALLWFDAGGAAPNFTGIIAVGPSTNSGFLPVDPTGYSVVVDTEYHVVMTLDATNTRLYINGVLRATASITGTWQAGEQIFLGSEPLARFFNGTLRGAAIYNKTLSGARIAAHATAAGF